MTAIINKISMAVLLNDFMHSISFDFIAIL